MATLKQIQNRLEKLQARAENLIAKRTSAVIGEIRDLMAKHGLTLADLGGHASRGGKRGRKAGVSQSVAKANGIKAGGTLPPKYLNPETGATWSGHARPPAWIKDAKDRSVFLIDKSAAGATARKASAPKEAAVAKKAHAAKRAVTRKAAAKKTVASKKTAAPKKTAAAKKAATPRKAAAAKQMKPAQSSMRATRQPKGADSAAA